MTTRGLHYILAAGLLLTAPLALAVTPTLAMGFGNQANGLPLSEISNVQQQIDNAPVRDAGGDVVGHVKSVQIGSDGTAQTVEVALNTNHMTAKLNGSALSYDRSTGTVNTQLDKAQIQKFAKKPSAS